MSSLPEELWRRILEIGIGTRGLTYKDLCCISISCRRLHRLSGEDPLWNRLLSSDFPLNHTSYRNPSRTSSSDSSSPKSLYKSKFERKKEWRIAAHRRVVLSQIAEHSRKLQEIETPLGIWTTRMRESASEYFNLRRVRQASVALDVWSTEVFRSELKKKIEQCLVPAESRIRALEMEFRLCQQQIMELEKSYTDEKRRLDTAKQELESVKYHPVREHKPVSGGENKHTSKKKLKRCNSLQQKQYEAP